MKNRYVRMALIIAALALGLAVLATFVGFGAVRVAPDGSAKHG
jgi:hypothetical protein